MPVARGRNRVDDGLQQESVRSFVEVLFLRIFPGVSQAEHFWHRASTQIVDMFGRPYRRGEIIVQFSD